MARIEPYEQERQYVRRMYGTTCAACGCDRGIGHVGHLYEDATKGRVDRYSQKRRADRYALIILCPTCNIAEESVWTVARYSVETLDPSAVRVVSERKYKDGAYAQAYASSRLASYLFERCGKYTLAIDCLTEAISALRPMRRGDYIRDTLHRASCLCEDQLIGRPARWRLLDRFALALYDYSSWADCLLVQSAGRYLLQHLPTPGDPQTRNFDEANSFRRHALIRASTNSPDKGETIEKYIGRLEEDATGFVNAFQWDSFATNLDVARKLSIEVLGDFERAHRYSQRALERLAQTTHKWVLQEHYFSEARYYHSRGANRLMRSVIMEGLRIRSNHPVALEPVLERGGPVQRGVDELLERCGIDWKDIQAEDSSIAHWVDGGSPLEISSARILKIARALVGDPKTRALDDLLS